MTEPRMSDKEFKEIFSPMELSRKVSATTYLLKEAMRAREAEKYLLAQVENVITVDRYLKHFNESSLTDFVIKYEKLKRENVELKAELKLSFIDNCTWQKEYDLINDEALTREALKRGFKINRIEEQGSPDFLQLSDITVKKI